MTLELIGAAAVDRIGQNSSHWLLLLILFLSILKKTTSYSVNSGRRKKAINMEKMFHCLHCWKSRCRIQGPNTATIHPPQPIISVFAPHEGGGKEWWCKTYGIGIPCFTSFSQWPPKKTSLWPEWMRRKKSNTEENGSLWTNQLRVFPILLYTTSFPLP